MCERSNQDRGTTLLEEARAVRGCMADRVPACCTAFCAPMHGMPAHVHHTHAKAERANTRCKEQRAKSKEQRARVLLSAFNRAVQAAARPTLVGKTFERDACGRKAKLKDSRWRSTSATAVARVSPDTLLDRSLGGMGVPDGGQLADMNIA